MGCSDPYDNDYVGVTEKQRAARWTKFRKAAKAAGLEPETARALLNAWDEWRQW
jgi:hypothetical protein